MGTLSRLVCNWPLRGAAAIAVGFVLSVPVNAQDAIEEILVTAQKRTESLKDVPISISVTTEAQLQRDQIYNITDLARTTPGLEVQPTFGAEASGGGRVRGIGTNVFNESAVSSVAVVVDQIPGGNIAMPEIFDMAQVEVLRGPQGTLFGQSASAGVINVTTKAPDSEAFSADFGVTYAWEDYDRQLISGSLNLPVSENSAFRLSGRFNSTEGVQTNRALGRDNKSETMSFRARFLTEPTDDLRIDLIAEYHDLDEDDLFMNLAIAPTQTVNGVSPEAQTQILTACGPAGNFQVEESGRVYCSEQMPHFTREWISLAAIVDWGFTDNLTLTSVSTWREKDIAYDYRNFSRAYGQVLAQVYNEGENGEQLTQELRIASDSDSAFNYVAGVYFTDYDFSTSPSGGTVGDLDDPAGFVLCNYAKTFCNGPPPPIGPIWPQFTFQEISVQSQSIYFDGNYQLSDSLTLIGGLRYTNEETKFAIGVNGPPTNSGSNDDSEPSGRLGLRWILDDGTMAYATVSRGFKPSFVSVNPNPNVPVTVLKPEINTSFEIGTKFSWLDETLRIDANAFYMQVEDYQAQSNVIIDNELTSIPTNIPEIDSYGLEVSAYGAITDYFDVNLGYLFNVAEYPDGYLSDDPVPGDLGGEQLALSPEHKFTMSGEYFRPFSGTLEGFVNLNAVYKSDILMGQRVAPIYTYDAHWTLGGAIGLRNERWRATLYGRNLTDEPFPIGVLASQFQGQENGGLRVWAAPGVTAREVGVTFDINF